VWVLVAIVVVFGCCVLSAIPAAIAIPNLIHARKHANETAAIGALKTITIAESVFREGDKDANGKLDFGSLAALEKAQLVDSVLGAGTKQGYFFEAQPSTTTPEFLWWAVARPQVPGSSGDRVFYTNQEGVIYFTLYAGGEHVPPPPDPSTCKLPAGLMRLGR
jgi:hypothetical protein